MTSIKFKMFLIKHGPWVVTCVAIKDLYYNLKEV